MSDARLHPVILQVNTTDGGGGAAVVAGNLFRSYRSLGYASFLAVGKKRSDDPDIVSIAGGGRSGVWARSWRRAADGLEPPAGRSAGVGRARGALEAAAEPGRWWRRRLGHEDFGFPGTLRMLSLTARPPDIVHCHNLHGDYFDLRVLPWLSSQRPTLLTLHDAWVLGGHCAHSLDCTLWETGCGPCPDLGLYQPLRRDATPYNWNRKKDIYVRSRVYVATPCEWLLDKVRRSTLAAAMVQGRVIPNGVDLSVFRPASRPAAREMLSLPPDATILLAVAQHLRLSPWKDYGTLLSAVARIADSSPQRQVICLALGDDSPPQRLGRAELRAIPYQSDPATVARYYQAADLLLHPARAETMGLTIIEALACGTPVVATAVGGIPEEIDHGRTGLLVPPADPEAMALAASGLLRDPDMLARMSADAAADARRRFDLAVQVGSYLAWYEEILVDWRPAAGALPGARS